MGLPFGRPIFFSGGTDYADIFFSKTRPFLMSVLAAIMHVYSSTLLFLIPATKYGITLRSQYWMYAS